MSQMPALASEADEHASFINTLRPVLGGNSALGDAEIKASVEYMVGQSQ